MVSFNEVKTHQSILCIQVDKYTCNYSACLIAISVNSLVVLRFYGRSEATFDFEGEFLITASAKVSGLRNQKMVKMDFGGVIEDVITRKEFTVAQAQKILKDEVVVSLGYGIQGQAQSLNMRDNGIKVIIGQEKEGVFKK